MAQTLKFGKGTWATKKGSTLSYNDESNNYKPLPFTTTRNSSATRVNKEGLIEVVENDRPRIDYTDSADGVLLLENSATNLVTYSEDFSNVAWVKTGASVTSGFISPDGSLNAFKLVQDTSNSTHELNTVKSVTSGLNYTYSVRIKNDNVKYVRLFVYDVLSKFVIFDLEAGSVFTESNATGTIKPLSNGYYECSFTYLQSQTTNETFRLYLLNDNQYPEYQGDGTSGVYIYGAQLEQGSYATSYIPTSGSTVTRVAETASGSGNSEVFNSEQGTLFVDLISSGGTTDGYISISDLTTNNRLAIRIGYNNSNQVSLFMVSNGGSSEFEEFYNVGSLGFRNFNKFALKYKVNDVSLFFNGFEVITISSAAMASGFKSLNFANATGGTQPFYGKTKEIGYYDTALTDLELEKLTSYVSLSEMATELNYKAL